MTSGRLPAVDDRLVDPEQNIEIIDGEVFPVVPAREPHGDRHSKLSSLLEACVVDGFNVASDMLTRTSHDTDLAPDASIYPRARDPETGGRQLEHLAFEVVSQQTLAHVARRARALGGRGVRRVFAIDVKRTRVLEWSARTDDWQELPSDACIEDEVLAAPLPVAELASCVSTRGAVARMLLVRGSEVLESALVDREREALRQSILSVLRARGLSVTDDQRQTIEATTDLALLRHWVCAAATCDEPGALLRSRPEP